jgi:hypothetical protein
VPNNKDQRTHFKQSSQIDLSFPDIKAHVYIESTRNNGLTNTTGYNVLGLSSLNMKPPLASRSEMKPHQLD